MYFDYNDYVTYYGKGVCFQDFNRLSIEACRKQSVQVHSHPHTTISYQRSVEPPRFFLSLPAPSFPPGHFFQIIV